MNLYVFVYIFTHIHVYKYICIYTYIYIRYRYIYVYTYIFTYIQIHIYIYIERVDGGPHRNVLLGIDFVLHCDAAYWFYSRWLGTSISLRMCSLILDSSSSSRDLMWREVLQYSYKWIFLLRCGLIRDSISSSRDLTWREVWYDSYKWIFLRGFRFNRVERQRLKRSRYWWNGSGFLCT